MSSVDLPEEFGRYGYPAPLNAVRVHIVPRLGQVPLQDLTRKLIRELYGTLRARGRARVHGSLSAKSVHNMHLAFH